MTQVGRNGQIESVCHSTLISACGHCYCLRCVIRMWNSENDELEEEDNPNPVICPMCRETVLKFSWTGPSTIPSELTEYNQRYEDYTPQDATHSSKKFSSGMKFSKKLEKKILKNF